MCRVGRDGCLRWVSRAKMHGSVPIWHGNVALSLAAEKADAGDSNEVYITHLMETVTGEERKTRDDRSG